MTPIQFTETKVVAHGHGTLTYRAPKACPVCKADFGTCDGMKRYGFRFSLDEQGFAHEPFRYTGAAKCETCGCCNDGWQCSDCYHKDEFMAGLDGDPEDWG